MTDNTKDVTDRLIKEAEERGEIKAMVTQLLQSDREIQKTLMQIQQDMSVNSNMVVRLQSLADENRRDIAEVKHQAEKATLERAENRREIDKINGRLAWYGGGFAVLIVVANLLSPFINIGSLFQ